VLVKTGKDELDGHYILVIILTNIFFYVTIFLNIL
jgi:hypothetical protein